MVDDTYYITPHEAALAVVATSMKKSRLPFYILCINSIMGAFLFSAGSMLYIMCEAGSSGLRDSAGIFVFPLQGGVYALGLFYVIICGMELFNSNILFFSVGVLRGAVTLMDLLISWFVSFWVNLAGTIFIVYVFCFCSGVFKQPIYVDGTRSIAELKDSFTFAETLLKAIIGNFFVCLAVYLQIMVKPLHVKFLMIFLPIFTFVAMGFTHVVADMFLVPAGIFNDCGYGFGHYFWKIMLPGALGNIIGGSFFGIAITWFLHLVVIERDMKKLNLPAYEERDEQPMLNMDSRVVRVPTTIPEETDSTTSSSIREFKPDDENDISRIPTRRTVTSTGYISRAGSNSSIHSRSSKLHKTLTRVTSRQIRSPKGVFPVVDMGEPLRKEKTIAAAYLPPRDSLDVASSGNDIDYLIDNSNDGNEEGDDENPQSLFNESENDDEVDEDIPLSVYSGHDDHSSNSENDDDVVDDDGNYISNPYDPEKEKVSSKLVRALSKTVTRHQSTSDGESNEEGFGLTKSITRTATRIEHDLEMGLQKKIPPPPKAATKPRDRYPSVPVTSSSDASFSKRKLSNNKLFRQFTFGGGGNDTDEINRRLSNARITKKASGMSNDVAGIGGSAIDTSYQTWGNSVATSLRSVKSNTSTGNGAPLKKSKTKNNKNNNNNNNSNSNNNNNIITSKSNSSSDNNNWKHVNFDYEYSGERPVSFISERSENSSVDPNTEIPSKSTKKKKSNK